MDIPYGWLSFIFQHFYNITNVKVLLCSSYLMISALYEYSLVLELTYLNYLETVQPFSIANGNYIAAFAIKARWRNKKFG